MASDRYTIDLLGDLSNINKIRDGNFYTAIRSTTALGASSWMDLVLITSTSTSVEVQLEIQINNSGGLSEINLMEVHSTGSTQITQPTATVTAINVNRLSTFSASASVYNDSTGLISAISSTQVTYLLQDYKGSTGSTPLGDNPNVDRVPFKLNQGTTYICRLINRNAAGYASMRIFWNEE